MSSRRWKLVASFLALCLLLMSFSRGLPAQDTPEAPSTDETQTTIKASRETKTVKLPAAIDDLTFAGSGKFILAHLKSVQKLAVIDVAEAKVVKYINIAAPEILFAGGAEKFFIVLKDQSIIQRWDLKTLERELAVPITGNPANLAIGHASLGPLLVGGGTQPFQSTVDFLDVKTLRPIEKLKVTRMGHGFECGPNCIVRASANGKTFTAWRTATSPTGFFTLLLDGDSLRTFYEHESLGLLSPSPDGNRIFTGGGIHTNEAKPVSAPTADRWKNVLHASVTGDYIVQTASQVHIRDEQPQDVTILLAGDSRPLLTLSGIVSPRPRFSSTPTKLYVDKRIMFFPDALKLVLIPNSDDSIEFVTLDIEAELEKSEIDFLFFTSRPPLSAAAGELLAYDAKVKSKQGDVKFSLASGPPGMKLDASGKLTWKIPANESGRHDVILSASDKSGQEVFQTFALNITGGAQHERASSTRSSMFKAKAKSDAPVNTDVTPPSVDAATSAPVKLNLGPLTPAPISGEMVTIKLPAAAQQVAVGGGGRFIILYLQSLRKLAVVDVTAAKIVGYIPADDSNVQFAAGEDKLVMVLGEKNIISRWSLSTLQRELAVPIQGPIQNVVMGSASKGPVLVVGQSSGNPTVGTKFYNLDKLTPIDTKLQHHGDAQMGKMARASADGRTFCIPGSFGPAVITYDGEQFQASQNQQRDSQMGGLVLPSPDGKVLYCGPRRFTPDLVEIGQSTQNFQEFLVPAAHGMFYLSVRIPQIPEQGKESVSVHLEGDTRPLVTMDDFSLFTGRNHDAWGHNSPAIDKRIIFVPDAKVIAALIPTYTELELRKFDLEESLESAGIDYLFVASKPPASAKPGDDIRYQIAVKSKKGGVKHRLESGPEGMAVSSDGLLTWKAKPGAHSVIVGISDSAGQEVFHTFKLSVEDSNKRTKPSAVASTIAAVAKEAMSTFDGNKADGPTGPLSPRSTTRSGDDFATPVAPSPFASLIGQSRSWTDATSGRKLEAKFVDLAGGKVKVITADGRQLAIPVDRLSREDLLWLLGPAGTAAGGGR